MVPEVACSKGVFIRYRNGLPSVSSTWDHSATGLERLQTDPNWTPRKAGPLVLDVVIWPTSFRIGLRIVPCKQKADPVQFSDRIHLEQVACKTYTSARASDLGPSENQVDSNRPVPPKVCS